MIIVNNSSEEPIYEQVYNQIKSKILSGELEAHTNLPSVRSLAKDLKISALTVKKSYDLLEKEGYIVTVHGKGSYVSNINSSILEEEQRRGVELDLEEAISKGRRCGMSDEELRNLFELIMEE